MIKTDYIKCTGCGACLQSCPKKCITWCRGEFGFKYPSVDRDICIDCGLCERVCPIEKHTAEIKSQNVYAVVNKDSQVLKRSTSGGAFSAIASKVLKDNGVVYGCIMGNSFKVKHVRIEKESQLGKLRGSKYVQSDTENTFNSVKSDLLNGIKVLYSGTPCQIDGLISFLGKKYDNLITVDIVCHGVGSQAYFNKFVDQFKKHCPSVERIEFRNKRFVGWSCGGVVVKHDSQGSKKVLPFYNYENYYYSYFLSGEIFRKSCYSCKYANTNRVADITLGDFWGIEKICPSFDSKDGCSLVIINTPNGEKVLNSIADNMRLINLDIESAKKNNAQLTKPFESKSSRSERLNEFNTLSGEEIQSRYMKSHAKSRVKGRLKTLIPRSVRYRLRRII